MDPNTGYVYLCGYVAGSIHGEPYVADYDIYLMKYDSTGSHIWTRMVGTAGLDVASGVVFDQDSDSVFVTGNSPSTTVIYVTCPLFRILYMFLL
ncbi:hypothetical protein EON63_20795 [archaeon]|nr:MAG: hypothetical protein EON63_20795 [archaeon]